MGSRWPTAGAPWRGRSPNATSSSYDPSSPPDPHALRPLRRRVHLLSIPLFRMVPVRVYRLGVGVYHRPRFRQRREAARRPNKLCRFGSPVHAHGLAQHHRRRVPVLYRGVGARDAGTPHRKVRRLPTDRRLLPVQAELPARGPVLLAALRRLAGEEILAGRGPARGRLLRLPVSRGSVPRSRHAIDRPNGPRVRGGEELSELRVLARLAGRALRDAPVERGCPPAATRREHIEVRPSTRAYNATGVFSLARVLPAGSVHGVLRGFRWFSAPLCTVYRTRQHEETERQTSC